MMIEITLLKDKISEMQERFKKVDVSRETYISKLHDQVSLKKQQELKLLADKSVDAKVKARVKDLEEQLLKLTVQKQEATSSQLKTQQFYKKQVKKLTEQASDQKSLIERKNLEVERLERKIKQKDPERHKSITTVLRSTSKPESIGEKDLIAMNKTNRSTSSL